VRAERVRAAVDDDLMLGKLVDEIRRIGRMPTVAGMNLRRSVERAFPSEGVFERYGPRAALPALVAE
jgi:hypothetical protein